MYTWKTTHSYLHLTKIQVCKTVNYHPNEYSACHISEPRCRKLKPSQGRGQWDSCHGRRACTASQCSFLPILQENWYWEGHAWEAEMCSRPGQTESVLSATRFSFCEQNGTIPCSLEQACSMTNPAPLPSCKGSWTSHEHHKMCLSLWNKMATDGISDVASLQFMRLQMGYTCLSRA